MTPLLEGFQFITKFIRTIFGIVTLIVVLILSAKGLDALFDWLHRIYHGRIK